MPRSDMEIKKIDDGAEAHPVGDIADRAADDQADRDREKRTRNPAQPEDEADDDRRGGEREDQGVEPGAAPAPALNRPKLMPRLQVRTRLKNERDPLAGANPCSPK